MFATSQLSDFPGRDLRIAVEADVVLIHRGAALTARLVDLSRSGAALSAVLPPPRDSAVTLELGGLAIAGRVVWTDGRRFGLRFETRLRATEVFRVSHRSRARPAIQ